MPHGATWHFFGGAVSKNSMWFEKVEHQTTIIMVSTKFADLFYINSFYGYPNILHVQTHPSHVLFQVQLFLVQHFTILLQQ